MNDKPAMTDPRRGLSDEEVAERVRLGRVNGDQNVKTKSVKQILAENVFTFFNLINVVLAALVFFVGSPKNALFALVIVFNTGIGIFQELRAKRTIDRLTLVSAPKARVLRGGEEREIATGELVADDLVIFRTGGQAAADCTVVEGECEVNESLITGESDPIYKTPGEKILSGSFIVSGEAKAVVTALGKESFTSRMTEGVKYVKKPQSKMMDAINLILKGIAICILPIMGLLFFNAISDPSQTFSRAVTSTVAAVIGMIPEGLVLLSSVVLAVSAIRLAQNKTLVQDLYCIETLARVDTLCLDKTGTITEGKMAVEEVCSFSGEPIDDEMRALASALTDVNPTLLAVREKWDQKSDRVAERVVPFSSAKKWSGAYFPGVGSLVMGAGEFILGDGYAAIRARSEAFAAGGR
ncbi:MAG: HAD-IC family P-type ATPase, partial [Roseburia sp.]|nr:HAD-IC family P-type ATPase [Roseburia sp.]